MDWIIDSIVQFGSDLWAIVVGVSMLFFGFCVYYVCGLAGDKMFGKK